MTPSSGDQAARSGAFERQLDWLLANVPRRPGSRDRFDIEDLIIAMVGEVSGQARWEARASARNWIDDMKAGPGTTSPRQTRRHLATLEAVFRLPPGYFDDESIQRETDERIRFAADAAERGITIIGPCRVRRQDLPLEALHSLYRRARTELDRRARA